MTRIGKTYTKSPVASVRVGAAGDRAKPAASPGQLRPSSGSTSFSNFLFKGFARKIFHANT